jgi:hypothetical protein
MRAQPNCQTQNRLLLTVLVIALKHIDHKLTNKPKKAFPKHPRRPNNLAL